ncbi:MAG: VOC family protein [Myxococcales bacterium]|nr:VOC family protein [Myxococcales bacterium]
MLRQTKVTNIFHYVADIDRTEAFYRDVLQLEVERQDGGEHGDILIAKTAGGLDLLFFQGEVRPGNSPVLVFDLAEQPIEPVVEHLVGHGSTIVTPVSPAPGGKTADFADPDGHVLSLYQPTE